MNETSLFMLGQVLGKYGLNPSDFSIEPFGSGLIHHTYLLKENDEDRYILQEVNTSVFTRPDDIASNLHLIGKYLADHFPEYFFPLPANTLTGESYAIYENRYFRLTQFVKNSHSINSCQSPEEAFEAARQFGKFTALLSGVDTSQLKYTIPGFHDLSWRWQQFRDALENGNPDRIAAGETQINYLTSQQHLVEVYESIKADKNFPLRVIHHDTKINNVLFDDDQKGICVIDLDTVMPGYFISDLGDMMRTYLSPADEESDPSLITIRTDFFEAIVKGYLQHMVYELNDAEKERFLYAGEFMIYMQALRFMTDHLNNDRYYGAKYEGHNLNRAINQITLLQKLKERQPELNETISRLILSSV
jgi:Ser/Thr protein kinase RdoA (MazF antagonist)